MVMPDSRITKFIERHHVLTLATLSEGGLPYCATCFYAYDRKRNMFVISSDETTRHAADMERTPQVSCAIALETRIVGRVQGVQICGKVQRGDEEARRIYLGRFPYAAAMPLTLWCIEPNFIKLTDNTLGFGNKTIWTATQQTK